MWKNHVFNWLGKSCRTRDMVYSILRVYENSWKRFERSGINESRPEWLVRASLSGDRKINGDLMFFPFRGDEKTKSNCRDGSIVGLPTGNEKRSLFSGPGRLKRRREGGEMANGRLYGQRMDFRSWWHGCGFCWMLMVRRNDRGVRSGFILLVKPRMIARASPHCSLRFYIIAHK